MSCLSNYYKVLYAHFISQDALDSNEPSTLSLPHWLSNDKLLQHQYGIEYHNQVDREYFVNQVPKLAKFITRNRGLIEEDPFEVSDLLSWLSNPKSMKRNGDLSSALEDLLELCPVIERSIGNVLQSSGVKVIPPLLRDLVLYPKLPQVIGFDAATVLVLLFGSPLSLNLRNLLWHGFLLPEEVSPTLVELLHLTLVKIGHYLQEQVFQVISRPVLKLSAASMPTFDFNIYTDPDYHRNQIIRRGIIHVQSQAYIKALFLILPELEAYLRWQFVKSNKAPLRLQSAETSDLYTTFTEIFSHSFGKEDNKLIPVIGTEVLELLFDLLVLPKGPRIRDKLSHGEVDYQSDDEDLKLTCLWAYCTMFVVMKKCKKPALVVSELNNYRSLFHPTSLICLELSVALQYLQRVQRQEWPNLDKLELLEHPQIEEFSLDDSLKDEVIFILQAIPETDLIAKLFECCQTRRFQTLFRPEVETRILTHVHRWSLLVNQLSSNIQKSLEERITNFKMGNLSVRTEKTLRRFIQFLPRLMTFVLVSITNILYLLCRKNDFEQYSQFAPKLIRCLTKCGHLTEKIASSFSPSSSVHWEDIEKNMTACESMRQIMKSYLF